MDSEIDKRLIKDEPPVAPEDTTFIESIQVNDEVEPQDVGVAVIDLTDDNWGIAGLFQKAGEITTQQPVQVMSKEQAEQFFKTLAGGGSLSKIVIILNKPTDQSGVEINENPDMAYVEQVLNSQIIDENGNFIEVKDGVNVIIVGPEDKQIIKKIVNNEDNDYTIMGMPTTLKEIAEKFGKTTPLEVLGCETGHWTTKEVKTPQPPNPTEIDTQKLD